MRADSGRRRGFVPVDRNDAIADLQSGRCRGGVALDLGDLRARAVRWCAGRVDDHEDDERDEDVHRRPGRDDRDALPGRLTPVRVAARPFLHLAQRAVRGTARRRAESSRPRPRPAARDRASVPQQNLGLERATDVLHRAGETRILAERRPHERVEVANRGPVHSRQTHVAARGDQPQSVLDAVAPEARELRARSRRRSRAGGCPTAARR